MATAYLKKAQSGRSMIEMLGVLAIVGVLSAGGVAGYSMAMQTYKTNQLIEKIQIIATQARAVYKGYYNGITKNNLINSGKLKASDFDCPFGGNLNIVNSGNPSKDIAFRISTPYNLPSEACTEILTANWGDEGVFLGIDVDGNDFGFRYTSGTYPIAFSTAVSICSTPGREIELFFK